MNILARIMRAEEAVDRDIELRATRKRKAIVTETRRPNHQDIAFLKEGTIVTIVGQRGSRYLEELRQSLAKNDVFRTRLLCEAIAQRQRDTLASRPSLRQVDAIVDVRYGGSWLAKHVLVPPQSEAAWSMSVWSGGDLKLDGFEVLEHARRASEEPLIEVMILLNRPQLTTLESSILRMLPAALSELNVKGTWGLWTDVQVYNDAVPNQRFANDIVERADQGQDLIFRNDQIPQIQQADQGQDLIVVNDQNQNQNQDFGLAQQRIVDQLDQQMPQLQQQQVQQDQAQQEQGIGVAGRDVQQDQGGQQDQAHQQDGELGMLGFTRDGYSAIPFDQSMYLNQLSRVNFQALDATQSVKELLRLREQMLSLGFG